MRSIKSDCTNPFNGTGNGNMTQPACSEADFIAICRKLQSAVAVAKYLGINERNVYSRRRSIEANKGISLPFHNGPIEKRVAELGYSATDWSTAWDKTDGLSVLVKNPNFTPDDYHSALDDAVASVRAVAPKFPKLKYAKIKDGHLVLINMTDMHFGGWGLDKASAVVDAALADALQKSSGYPIDKIVFVMGSDCLHTDTAGYTTTKGTQQVTDGSSYAQAFKAAQDAYTRCIATLAPIAPVHCVHVSGNHDELMSYALSQVIEATFSKAKNVTFDVTDSPRKYIDYGTSLIAITHGDKVKDADIPMIVSHEAAALWGSTRHRYVYMGHLHHSKATKYQNLKEHPGITLEWLRSPKPADKWHRDNGYLGSQGITTFIHSKDRGQVAKLVFNL